MDEKRLSRQEVRQLAQDLIQESESGVKWLPARSYTLSEEEFDEVMSKYLGQPADRRQPPDSPEPAEVDP